ncbi:MAG: hypothetical protein ABSC94_18465 [Polyangiaceae bacterium]
MFGLSFSELVLVLIVAMVVIGPKELPRYLRKAGQFSGRLRRLATEMREKSGIDEVLRSEGLDRDIAEIRRITRGELAGVATALRTTKNLARIDNVPANPYPATPYAGQPPALVQAPPAIEINREREYPTICADSYGALPADTPGNDAVFLASPLADDPLYARGEDPSSAAPVARETTSEPLEAGEARS